MAWTFGDSFDMYANTTTDPTANYWDSSSNANGYGLIAGRFTGSQCISAGSGPNNLVKSSGANDAVHHLVVAFRQTATLSGTTLGWYFQLSDGATNQCCVVFRSDGVILLTSATPAGAVLATYSSATSVSGQNPINAQNTWFAFEFEVVIGASGSFAARKNGGGSNDFSQTGLNTKPGTNPYANKLTTGMNAGVNAQAIDDLLWRSDSVANGVAWVGDIRCYTRMPSSDVQAQFSRSPNPNSQTPLSNIGSATYNAGQSLYSTFTATYDGSVTSVTLTTNAAYTGNIKAALFNSSGSLPTTVIASATNIITNPGAGTVTFTFAGVAIARGTQYWVGVCGDSASLQWRVGGVSSGVWSSTGSYASFPAANPSTVTTNGAFMTVTYNVTTNCSLVLEAQEDGTTSYVYDSNVGDNDLYAIAAIGGTPASTVCVTTRGFLQKSDAGARGAAVQLKSGATTVNSGGALLSSSWGWLWRTDTTDPNTSSLPWTATAVNNLQIGPIVTS